MKMADRFPMTVEVTPLHVRTGQQISADVRLGSDVGIAYVNMELAGTGYTLKMHPVGGGRYRYSIKLPRIVPPGNYTIRFYWVTHRGERGPATAVTVVVTK